MAERPSSLTDDAGFPISEAAALPRRHAIDLEAPELSAFNPEGVTARLLSNLSQRPYSAGSPALSAALSMVEQYQARSGGRVDSAQMVSRFEEVSRYAAELFAAHEAIDSVFFFGSALRGRQDARDVDIWCVVKPKVPLIDRARHPILHEALSTIVEIACFPFELLPFNPRQDPVFRLQDRLDRSGKRLFDLPIHHSVSDMSCGFSMICEVRMPPGSDFLLEAGPLVFFSRAARPGALGAAFFPSAEKFDEARRNRG